MVVELRRTFCNDSSDLECVYKGVIAIGNDLFWPVEEEKVEQTNGQVVEDGCVSVVACGLRRVLEEDIMLDKFERWGKLLCKLHEIVRQKDILSFSTRRQFFISPRNSPSSMVWLKRNWVSVTHLLGSRSRTTPLPDGLCLGLKVGLDEPFPDLVTRGVIDAMGHELR